MPKLPAVSILTTVGQLINEHHRLSYHGAGAATAKRLMEIGDGLCQSLTAAKSLNELCDAYVQNKYIPTIRADQGPGYKALAELYDYMMVCRGHNVKCHRGPKS